MSATAFFEPLPVIDFVALLLNTDIHSRPLSDAERVKVCLASISYSHFISSPGNSYVSPIHNMTVATHNFEKQYNGGLEYRSKYRIQVRLG